MGSPALRHLYDRIRRLETDAAMRKGRLVETVLHDPSVEWDAVFAAVAPRGRHRHRLRWRRAVIVGHLRRVFPRGGARATGGRRRPPVVAGAGDRGARPRKRTGDTADRGRWRVDPRELQEFAPLEVWERFRVAFPVLAVYRAGWSASAETSRGLADRIDAAAWEALWPSGRAALADVAAVLRWPGALRDDADLIVPVGRRLWPEAAWDGDDAAGVGRAAVPFVRRVACLLHGFHLGGCSPRGVWEAVLLPDRG